VPNCQHNSQLCMDDLALQDLAAELVTSALEEGPVALYRTFSPDRLTELKREALVYVLRRLDGPVAFSGDDGGGNGGNGGPPPDPPTCGNVRAHVGDHGATCRVPCNQGPGHCNPPPAPSGFPHKCQLGHFYSCLPGD